MVDTTGVISYEDPVELTFSGLDPDGYYTFVVYGDRNGRRKSYRKRVSTTSLLGANTFFNQSSEHARFSGPHDNTTSIRNGFNAVNGYVARF